MSGKTSENYTQWREACAAANLPIGDDMEWLSDLGKDIPLWSYIAPNNGSFFMPKIQAGGRHSYCLLGQLNLYLVCQWL